MFLAWAVFGIGGTMSARYFRHWGFGWLKAHIALQTISVAFNLIGFAVAVAHVAQLNRPHFVGYHEGAGLFLFILMFLQLVLGLVMMCPCKPSEDASRRPIFPDWVHVLLGFAAIILSQVNMFTGLYKAHASAAIVGVYSAYFAILVLLCIFLELIKHERFVKALPRGLRDWWNNPWARGSSTGMDSVSSNKSDYFEWGEMDDFAVLFPQTIPEEVEKLAQ